VVVVVSLEQGESPAAAALLLARTLARTRIGVLLEEESSTTLRVIWSEEYGDKKAEELAGIEESVRAAAALSRRGERIRQYLPEVWYGETLQLSAILVIAKLP